MKNGLRNKYGSQYDKHFDRVKLFAYLPATNKSESAYKFHLGKSKNNVIGITDLHRFNGMGYLSGHIHHLSSLLLFVTCIFGCVMAAPTEEAKEKSQPVKKETLGVRKRPPTSSKRNQHVYSLHTYHYCSILHCNQHIIVVVPPLDVYPFFCMVFCCWGEPLCPFFPQIIAVYIVQTYPVTEMIHENGSNDSGEEQAPTVPPPLLSKSGN